MNSLNQPMLVPGSQGRDRKFFELPIYPKMTGSPYDMYLSMAPSRRWPLAADGP